MKRGLVVVKSHLVDRDESDKGTEVKSMSSVPLVNR